MPYAGPIVIGSNRTLRAIAVSPDLTNSRVTSGAFYVPGTIVSTVQLNETTRGGYRLWVVAGTISYDPISGKWYWYGYSQDQIGVYTEGGIGLNIYSSADLRNWKFETVVLQAAAQTGSQPYFGDRARMLYNAANNNYVLRARQAFAAVLNVYAAPSPTGPFTQQNSFSTLDGFGTNGDFYLFQTPLT
jgi:hypothetical protein